MRMVFFSRRWLGVYAVSFGFCLSVLPPAMAQDQAQQNQREWARQNEINAQENIRRQQQQAYQQQAPVVDTPPPRRPLDNYASIAWHPAAADVWMEGGVGLSGVAGTLALEACKKVMGEGCVSTGEWKNSSMAVIRGPSNSFRLAWLGEGEAELRSVLEQCLSEQLLPCEVYMTFPSNQSHYRPGAEARKTYIAGAWGMGGDKLYVASGLPTLAEAEEQALSACRAADPKLTCKVPASGSGFIEAGTFDKGSQFVVTENSAERALLAGARYCQIQNSASDCQLQATFSSRTRKQFVHDFVTGRDY